MRAFIAFFLLAALTLPMNPGAMEALSDLTNLKIYRGIFIYLDGTADVAIKAKGRDFRGYYYEIRCRWKGGVPVALKIGDMEVGL